MCGIAAIVRLDGATASGQQLHRMLSMIAYRGPDEAGYTMLNDDRIGFGQVRLSIVDVSSGLQPMYDHTGDHCIIFNGEIYDHDALRCELEGQGHVFHTRTDTEVILALYAQYGLDCFKHLNGEFAFVLWDENKRRLVAARDRHGIKPLFWHRDKNAHYFCSEAKGILTLPGIPRQLDPKYLTGSMFGAWPTNTSAFSEITCLRPGHYLLLEQDQKPKEQAYWSASYSPEMNMSFDDAKEGVRHHLRQAVKRRLVADVPVCMYLSGGVDSSLVAAMAAGLGQKLKAFTLGFSNSIYDETQRARQTASFLGIPFEDVPCSVDSLAENFPKALFHTETCLGNAGAVGKMMLSKHVRKAGYKVALTGEGADELFAGYPYFKLELIQKMMLGGFRQRIRAKQLWDKFKTIEARSEGMLWTRSTLWRSTPMPYGYPSFLHVRAVEISASLPGLLRPEVVQRGGLPDAHFSQNFPPSSLEGMHQTHASLFMTLNWLSGYILINFADRLEMANSIEGRPAFLDHELATFAGRIPPEYLIHLASLREKYVLYEAYKSAIPEEVRQNHKHPFVSQSWRTLSRTAAGAEIFNDRLSRSAIADGEIFSYAQLSKMRLLWNILPQRSPLSKRLDTIMGLAASAQTLHQMFVRACPEPAHTVSIRRIYPRTAPACAPLDEKQHHGAYAT